MATLVYAVREADPVANSGTWQSMTRSTEHIWRSTRTGPLPEVGGQYLVYGGTLYFVNGSTISWGNPKLVDPELALPDWM